MLNPSSTLTLCRASAGTGKTYTLAHRYIDLLYAGESYRSILAVTFTNKATAEMKERILTYLYVDAHHAEDAAIRSKAQSLFDAILTDFDNMRVMTIDSFLQVLLNGLARSLGKAAGYAVELDARHAIITAVDEMMTTFIDEQTGLRERLSAYLSDQLESEKGWDFRAELINLAAELYKESVQKQEERADLFDRKQIDAFRQAVMNAEADENVKTITLKHLKDMLLLSYIRHQIEQDQFENNSILISNTARILHAALKEGDADFILEKAGIRYKHIMIDEFQDTSDMQWDILIQLVKEILAGGGTTLIVGDIKQSIYRFRNGNWQIMDQLGKRDGLAPYIHIDPLHRNYRSLKEVVQFNLDTFRTIAADLPFYEEGYEGSNIADYYVAGKHDGGYVSVRFYPYYVKRGGRKTEQTPSFAESTLTKEFQQRRIIEDMFTDIEGLMAKGAEARDILILIAKNKQVHDLMEVYDDLITDTATYPYIAQHRPVSGDSFHLDASPTILRIVEILREEKSDLPLTMQVKEIIRSQMCEDGVYTGGDVAYLNAFEDYVATYVSNYGSNRIAFLRYWDDEMHGKSLPVVNAGDMRIMTVHSSKGLEAKYVFIPQCNWKMVQAGTEKDILWAPSAVDVPKEQQIPLVPVSRTKELQNTAYSPVYDAENAAQRVDRMNMMYVAFTRAAEHLYVYSDITYTKKITNPSATAAHVLLCGLGYEPLLQSFWKEYTDSHCLPFFEPIRRGEPTVCREKAETVETDDKPFSFDRANVIEAQYRSDNMHIEFRQSLEAQYYQEDKQTRARDYGTLCHDILSHIEQAEQVQRVVDDYWSKGHIDTEDAKRHILSSLNEMIHHPLIHEWFSGEWTVLRERTIMMPDGTTYRPDRVMVREDKAIVLDYKFATPKRSHIQQVQHYCYLLQEMGYRLVQGYLYYEPSKRLEQVL